MNPNRTVAPFSSAASLGAALVVALAALSPAVHAHGDAKPMHGGVVKVANDMHYELVAQPDGASLYVIDHGKPADASKLSGKLTVLQGTQKSEAALTPAGGNQLKAAQVTLSPGAKAVASLKGADGRATTVRFVMP